MLVSKQDRKQECQERMQSRERVCCVDLWQTTSAGLMKGYRLENGLSPGGRWCGQYHGRHLRVHCWRTAMVAYQENGRTKSEVLGSLLLHGTKHSLSCLWELPPPDPDSGIMLHAFRPCRLPRLGHLPGSTACRLDVPERYDGRGEYENFFGGELAALAHTCTTSCAWSVTRMQILIWLTSYHKVVQYRYPLRRSFHLSSMSRT